MIETFGMKTLGKGCSCEPEKESRDTEESKGGKLGEKRGNMVEQRVAKLHYNTRQKENEKLLKWMHTPRKQEYGVFSLFGEGTDRQADSIHLHTDYAVSIVRWLGNYCNAQCSALQKPLWSLDKKSDLFLSGRLIGSHNGEGAVSVRGRRAKQEGEGAILCGLKKWRREGRRRKQRDDVQLSKIDFG